MSKIQKFYAHIELEDGTELVNLRVHGQDRIRWSTSAKINGWQADDEFRAQAFLAWSAARREEKYTGSFEEFTEGGAVDWSITDGVLGDDEDPTMPTA